MSGADRTPVLSPDAAIYVLSDLVGEVGGAAKATRLLCEALVTSGFRTTLFVAGRPSVEASTRLAESGVEVVTPWLDRGWRWSLPTRLLAMRLALAARRVRPRCVISVGLALHARLALRLRVPGLWLWETHEALPHVKFLDQKIGPLLRYSAGLIVPSESIRKNAASTYRFSGSFRKLPYWVEAPDAAPRTPVRSGVFLYLGRLDTDKGLGDLIDGFRLLHSRRPGTRLVVCGGGPVEPVQALAKGCAGIQIRGFVSRAELEESFGACEALVLPSLHEGYPLTLIEACARGRPFIATKVGSVPEVFGGHECAVLVSPGRSLELAEAMESLLVEEDARRLRRCESALKRFQDLSSAEIVQGRIRELMESL